MPNELELESEAGSHTSKSSVKAKQDLFKEKIIGNCLDLSSEPIEDQDGMDALAATLAEHPRITALKLSTQSSFPSSARWGNIQKAIDDSSLESVHGGGITAGNIRRWVSNKTSYSTDVATSKGPVQEETLKELKIKERRLREAIVAASLIRPNNASNPNRTSPNTTAHEMSASSLFGEEPSLEARQKQYREIQLKTLKARLSEINASLEGKPLTSFIEKIKYSHQYLYYIEKTQQLLGELTYSSNLNAMLGTPLKEFQRWFSEQTLFYVETEKTDITRAAAAIDKIYKNKKNPRLRKYSDLINYYEFEENEAVKRIHSFQTKELSNSQTNEWSDPKWNNLLKEVLIERLKTPSEDQATRLFNDCPTLASILCPKSLIGSLETFYKDITEKKPLDEALEKVIETFINTAIDCSEAIDKLFDEPKITGAIHGNKVLREQKSEILKFNIIQSLLTHPSYIYANAPDIDNNKNTILFIAISRIKRFIDEIETKLKASDSNTLTNSLKKLHVAESNQLTEEERVLVKGQLADNQTISIYLSSNTMEKIQAHGRKNIFSVSQTGELKEQQKLLPSPSHLANFILPAILIAQHLKEQNTPSEFLPPAGENPTVFYSDPNNLTKAKLLAKKYKEQLASQLTELSTLTFLGSLLRETTPSETTLDFSAYSLNDSHIPVLCGIFNQRPDLKSVNVRNNTFTPKTDSNQTLSRISQSSWIGHEFPKLILEQEKTWEQLISLDEATLDLSYKTLFDEDIEPLITFLETHPKIKILNVSSNKFTEQASLKLATYVWGHLGFKKNDFNAEKKYLKLIQNELPDHIDPTQGNSDSKRIPFRAAATIAYIYHDYLEQHKDKSTLFPNKIRLPESNSDYDAYLNFFEADQESACHLFQWFYLNRKAIESSTTNNYEERWEKMAIRHLSDKLIALGDPNNPVKPKSLDRLLDQDECLQLVLMHKDFKSDVLYSTIDRTGSLIDAFHSTEKELIRLYQHKFVTVASRAIARAENKVDVPKIFDTYETSKEIVKANLAYSLVLPIFTTDNNDALGTKTEKTYPSCFSGRLLAFSMELTSSLSEGEIYPTLHRLAIEKKVESFAKDAAEFEEKRLELINVDSESLDASKMSESESGENSPKNRKTSKKLKTNSLETTSMKPIETDEDYLLNKIKRLEADLKETESASQEKLLKEARVIQKQLSQHIAPTHADQHRLSTAIEEYRTTVLKKDLQALLNATAEYTAIRAELAQAKKLYSQYQLNWLLKQLAIQPKPTEALKQLMAKISGYINNPQYGYFENKALFDKAQKISATINTSKIILSDSISEAAAAIFWTYRLAYQDIPSFNTYLECIEYFNLAENSEKAHNIVANFNKYSSQLPTTPDAQEKWEDVVIRAFEDRLPENFFGLPQRDQKIFLKNLFKKDRYLFPLLVPYQLNDAAKRSPTLSEPERENAKKESAKILLSIFTDSFFEKLQVTDEITKFFFLTTCIDSLRLKQKDWDNDYITQLKQTLTYIEPLIRKGRTLASVLEQTVKGELEPQLDNNSLNKNKKIRENHKKNQQTLLLKTLQKIQKDIQEEQPKTYFIKLFPNLVPQKLSSLIEQIETDIVNNRTSKSKSYYTREAYNILKNNPKSRKELRRNLRAPIRETIDSDNISYAAAQISYRYSHFLKLKSLSRIPTKLRDVDDFKEHIAYYARLEKSHKALELVEWFEKNRRKIESFYEKSPKDQFDQEGRLKGISEYKLLNNCSESFAYYLKPNHSTHEGQASSRGESASQEVPDDASTSSFESNKSITKTVLDLSEPSFEETSISDLVVFLNNHSEIETLILNPNFTETETSIIIDAISNHVELTQIAVSDRANPQIKQRINNILERNNMLFDLDEESIKSTIESAAIIAYAYDNYLSYQDYFKTGKLKPKQTLKSIDDYIKFYTNPRHIVTARKLVRHFENNRDHIDKWHTPSLISSLFPSIKADKDTVNNRLIDMISAKPDFEARLEALNIKISPKKEKKSLLSRTIPSLYISFFERIGFSKLFSSKPASQNTQNSEEKVPETQPLEVPKDTATEPGPVTYQKVMPQLKPVPGSSVQDSKKPEPTIDVQIQEPITGKTSRESPGKTPHPMKLIPPVEVSSMSATGEKAEQLTASSIYPR